MVTFSKKAQTAGYFFGDRMLVPDKAYRQFNTWIGDPARAVLSRTVVSEILKNDLAGQCVSWDPAVLVCCWVYFADWGQARVGEVLFSELEKLAAKYPDHIQNLRGKGRG